jgi:hypothetical protein
MHLALLGLALAAATAGQERIAIYPLAAQGVPAEVMQQLDAAVRIEVGRIEAIEAPGEAESKAAVTKPCDGELRCLSEFGRALRASQVLFGEVRSLPDSFAVTLRLLDVATEKEIASMASSVNRDVEEMVWATRAQVSKLKAPREASTKQEESEIAAVLSPASGPVPEVEIAAVPSSTSRPSRPVPEPVPEPVQIPSALPSPAEMPNSALKTPPGGKEETASRAWPAWPGYAALGLGAALLAGGIVQEVRASGLRDELETLRGADGLFPAARGAEVISRRDKWQLARSSGWVLIGAGLTVAAGGGAYHWFVRPFPSGAGIAVSGAF